MFYIGIVFSLITLGWIFLKVRLDVNKSVILNTYETNLLKAVAILIVIISHYYRYTNSFGIERIFVSMGYLGAALFCFLSAYGTTKSFLNKGFESKYLIFKLKKIYVPFVIINLVQLLLLNEKKSNLVNIQYLFGVKLLDGVLWYIPFIMGYYIVFYYIYSVIKESPKRLTILLFISIVYMIVCMHLGISEQWYTSVLCIPLGCFFAENERQLCNISLTKTIYYFIISIVFLVALVGVNLLCNKYFVIKIITTSISAVCFCFCIILLSKTSLYESKIYSFIGRVSFYIYLTHIKVLNLLFSNTSHEYVILYVLVSLGVGVIVKYFINLKKLISNLGTN